MNKLELKLTQAELRLFSEYLDNYTMIQVISSELPEGERWLKVYHESHLPLIVSFKGV